MYFYVGKARIYKMLTYLDHLSKHFIFDDDWEKEREKKKKRQLMAFSGRFHVGKHRTNLRLFQFRTLLRNRFQTKQQNKNN